MTVKLLCCWNWNPLNIIGIFLLITYDSGSEWETREQSLNFSRDCDINLCGNTFFEMYEFTFLPSGNSRICCVVLWYVISSQFLFMLYISALSSAKLYFLINCSCHTTSTHALRDKLFYCHCSNVLYLWDIWMSRKISYAIKFVNTIIAK